MIRAFFGHHKCGTHWIKNILEEVSFLLGLKLHTSHPIRPVVYREKSLTEFTKEQGIDLISYTDSPYEYIGEAAPLRGFHVIRDPRDILVSAYFSHLYSHKLGKWEAVAKQRRKLSKVSRVQGIFFEMEFMKRFFRFMEAWDYDDERIMDIKMEELASDPLHHFKKIFSFLNLYEDNPNSEGTPRPIFPVHSWNKINYLNSYAFPLFRRKRLLGPSELKTILERTDFSKLAKGRRKGQENPFAHFRKGKAGDWKNHFTAEHKRVFKEKYGDLLIKLGYEKDHDW